jgi:epsilon-lactone hydrolase
MASPQYARVLAHVARLMKGGEAGPMTDAEYVAASRAWQQGYAAVDGVEPVPDPATVVAPVSAGGVSGEWITTPASNPARRLLWIHGGGWVACSPLDYRNITEALANAAGAAVLAIDYRLAPEHPYPAGLDDCVAAYLWLRGNGPQGPGAATSVWVAGDSAGGNLTLALLLRLKAEGLPLPAAAAAISPATDLTASGSSMRTRAATDPMLRPEGIARIVRIYVQDGTPLTHPYVSPLFGDLAGLPPLRLHVGDREILLDDTLRFADRARAAGVDVEQKVWPEMFHVFEGFCHMLPEGRQSLTEIGAFLRTYG